MTPTHKDSNGGSHQPPDRSVDDVSTGPKRTSLDTEPGEKKATHTTGAKQAAENQEDESPA